MCECFLKVAANISSRASPPLRQLMWFGELAAPPTLPHLPLPRLTATNNKMTPWLDNFSPV